MIELNQEQEREIDLDQFLARALEDELNQEEIDLARIIARELEDELNQEQEIDEQKIDEQEIDLELFLAKFLIDELNQEKIDLDRKKRDEKRRVIRMALIKRGLK